MVKMQLPQKHAAESQVPAPRIVISRLSAHGDVIQTLPLLAAIKRMFPNAVVGWVVEPSAAPLLENHPLIDALHVYPLKRWLKQLKSPAQWGRTLKEFAAFLSELRAYRYTYGFDVQGLLKSATILFFAGIPKRVGYKGTREFADLFYTLTLPYHDLKNPHVPTVYKFMEFVHLLTPLLGGEKPRMPRVHYPLPPVSEVSQARVDALLSDFPEQPITIALAPSTIWSSKHWSMASWGALLALLLALPNIRFLLLGAPGDETKMAQLFAQIPERHRYSDRIRNLTGKTELVDLYALFRQVDLLIGLDSAPLHIANAVAASTGKPSILGLYGPTSPQRTGPIGAQHQTLSLALSCQPCFERTCPLQTTACLTTLSVEQVYQKSIQILSGLPSSESVAFQDVSCG